MAACSIFDEDEVCIPISSGGFKYGLVVESSEYISSDDEDGEVRVHRGQVKIAWHPNGEETVVSEKKLILTDRSLIPGDVVRRLIDGEESQRGYVLDSHIKCHVKVLSTEQYIYNIDAKHIKPIQEWDSEAEVTLDSWVGNVLEVNEELTVRFPCGARCRLSNPGMLNLEDVHDKRDHHSEFVMRNFYPGQELAGSYEDFQDAVWIHTTNRRGPDIRSKSIFNAHVIVKEVKTVSVDVHWVCKGFSHPGDSIDHLHSPPNLVEGENLKRMKRLDLLEHCHLQIGDKGYYVITESDTILHKVSPGKHVTPDIIELANKENIVHGTLADGIVKQRDINKSNVEKLEDKNDELEHYGNKQDDSHALDKDKINDDDAVVNADEDLEEREDQCDDNDSDSGSTHSGAEFTAPLRKKKKHAAHVMKLHRKAKKKTVPTKIHFQRGDKVPIEIWYTFSTCDVMWQDGTVEYGVPSPELFPIHHLDEHEYFPGDFIVDSKVSYDSGYGVIVSCHHKERTVMVKWMKPYIPGKSTKPEQGDTVELSVFDIKDHSDYTFRCGHTVIRVGGYEDDGDLEAVGLVLRPDPDGTVHVWWPSGAIRKCYPQDLYIISDEYESESGSSEEWSDEGEEEEELESNESWETEDELSASESDGEEKKKSETSWTVSESKKKEIDAMLDRAQAALAGLLNIFISVSVPLFKNSHQVFQDILSIFKRCKQFEDILKTSFLENNEILDLITEVKEEYQKEKADKFARHVAQVYKFRTTGGTAEDLKKVIDTSTERQINKEEMAKKTADEVDGAVGGRPDDNKDFTRFDKMTKVLSDYGSDIDDPIMQIIFETSLLATIAECAGNGVESAKSYVARAHTDSMSAACDVDPLNIDDTELCTKKETLKHESIKNIIHTILDSVCDPDNHKLKKSFEAVKQRVVEAYNIDGQFSCENLKEDNSEPPQFPATEAGDHFAQNSVSHKNSKTKDAVMKSNQKELCIRVCKALNIQLMHIQQELHRKWLATKFGFDKNATNFEVLEKMQTETLESVKNSSEKPQIKSEKHEQSGVTDVECVRQLDAVGEINTLSVAEKLSETDVEKANKTVTEENKADDALITGDIVEGKGFVVCSETPFCHKYKCREHKSSNQKTFSSAIRKEWLLLRSNLPDGIHVKVFEDRMDLFSVLIKGPANTPYEGGQFIFDIQVPSDFPNRPPELFYHSYCNERLNPNLYQDGKVCVSLLGTWTGKGNELWTSKSSVLQVLVSIQGLILVSEPYFNEAGYEKQRGTQHGQENSRMYNEMAVLKVVQSMTAMAVNPPEIFLEETITHLKNHALKMIERIERWIEMSNKHRMEDSQRVSNINHPATHSINQSASDPASKSTSANSPTTSQIEHCMDTKQDLSEALKPGFPLMPASKGFCLSMQQHLQYYREALAKHIFIDKSNKI